MNRKDFITQSSTLVAGFWLGPEMLLDADGRRLSKFSKKLKPVGRRLQLDGYYVWCNSPILDADGMVHVFFSRWDVRKKMSGWINGSEIAHAVAKSPESDFEVKGTVLAPRKEYWDATTCHNPFITTFNGIGLSI